MGLVSFEEILRSAAIVAAVISGLFALAAARSAKRATLTAARFAADEAREKEARAALGRAIVGWQIAAKEDAEWRVRQESAGQARAALIELSIIPAVTIRTPEFDQIVELLTARSEADLAQADELWPKVEAEMRKALGPSQEAPRLWPRFKTR